MKRMTMWRGISPMLILCALGAFGCGMIADKERIKIAKIDNRYITRGDLARVISLLEPIPNIRNRGDALRILEQHIDEELKKALGSRLESEGKINVPREAAAARYDQENPDEAKLATIPLENNPNLAKIAQDYNLTPADLAAMKDRREDGIDKVHELMKGDAALQYRIQEGLNDGSLTITAPEFETEYKLRKDELTKFEAMEFLAIGLPINANLEAAQIMKRIDAGETFDAIAAEYYARNPNFILRSGIENNPSSEKLRGFWQNASGAEKGAIIGPVFLPSPQRMSEDEQGRRRVETMPDAWLVLEVLDCTPATTKTLDEAKDDMAPSILLRKMTKKLREQHGVEVYEDKLEDPAMLGEGF